MVDRPAPGTLVAHLPYVVHGDVSRPMRLSVLTVGQERGSVQAFTVDLPAGQTSGSVPVSYTAALFLLSHFWVFAHVEEEAA